MFGLVFLNVSYTSKKDILSTGSYHLPRLQEIVVPVVTANIMAPHAVPKQKLKQNHSLGIAIYFV
jgi:hypothetical protein